MLKASVTLRFLLPRHLLPPLTLSLPLLCLHFAAATHIHAWLSTGAPIPSFLHLFSHYIPPLGIHTPPPGIVATAQGLSAARRTRSLGSHKRALQRDP